MKSYSLIKSSGIYPDVRCSGSNPFSGMKAGMGKRWLHLIVIFILVCNDQHLSGQSFSVLEGPVVPLDSMTAPFTQLSIEDGLSQGMVTHIFQDHYGFMWFGTKDGLNRYDGYGFTIFRHEPTNEKSIGESMISCLYEDRENRLWIGTNTGLDLFHRETESFIHIPIHDEPSSLGSPIYIRMDLHGDIWVACTNSLLKLTVKNGISYDGAPQVETKVYGNTYTTLFLNEDGSLLSSYGNRLYRIYPDHGGNDRFELIHAMDREETLYDFGNITFTRDTLRNVIYGIYPDGIVVFNPENNALQRIFTSPSGKQWMQCSSPSVDKEGIIWLATFSGLFRFDPKSLQLTMVQPEDENLRAKTTIIKWTCVDRSGTVWMGTGGYGLIKYDLHQERFHKVTDESIRGITPALNGKVIVTKTEKLLSVFDPKLRRYDLEIRDEPFKKHPELAGREVQAASDAGFQDEQGLYWLGINGLVRYNASNNALKKFAPRPDQNLGYVPGNDIFPIAPGRNNVIWCGADSALLRFDKSTEQFTGYRFPIPPKVNPYLFTQVIYEDMRGVVWIGTLKGLLRFDPATNNWRHFAHDPSNDHSISEDVIFSIVPDPKLPDKILWIGTNGGGLNRFDCETGRAEYFKTAQGLPNDVVYGIVSDRSGNLWLSTNKGISCFNPELKSFRNFRAKDGLQSDEFNRYAYCANSDGVLFFGGVGGINYFRPEDLKIDSIPAVVRITDLLLMNKSVTFGQKDSPLTKPVYLSEGIEIPYSINMITFRFATMEFANPERHQYQYKLEGFDPEWIMAGTSNEANYTNLDPGTYTFLVKGDNLDGVWSDVPARFVLVVRPPWWMTWWFFMCCVLAIGGGVLWYILDLRWKRNKLEKIVVERTRELTQEKNRSDELLNNILPKEVSAELKAKGYADARYFERAIILFADFADFSGQLRSRSPQELISEVDICFQAFDGIMEKYAIEKIKTIGDTYMAAGGIPDPSQSNAEQVIHAALEMQDYMAWQKEERMKKGLPYFEMRVGIHCGPVVAGIVGMRKFAYDIWGDTVNTASRMEHYSEVGRVNLSAETYELVKHQAAFSFEPRGIIAVKGKGNMQMFFVSKK